MIYINIYINIYKHIVSLRFLLNSFVSTDNDIYKCNDEEQLAIIPPFACRYNNGKDHRKFLAIADEIGNVRIINTEKEGGKLLYNSYYIYILNNNNI